MKNLDGNAFSPTVITLGSAENFDGIEEIASRLAKTTLTKREYACIHLGIPESGDAELDALIRKAERSKIAEENNAVKKKNVVKNGSIKGAYFVPKKYEKNLPIRQKMMYALSNLKEATVDEIIEYLHKIGPEMNDKAKSSMRAAASREYRYGFISARPFGKSYKYIFHDAPNESDQSEEK